MFVDLRLLRVTLRDVHRFNRAGGTLYAGRNLILFDAFLISKDRRLRELVTAISSLCENNCRPDLPICWTETTFSLTRLRESYYCKSIFTRFRQLM